MKTLRAAKDFNLDGTFYLKGEEVKVNSISTVKKLNEKGFIEPLELKDLVVIERQLKKEILNEEE